MTRIKPSEGTIYNQPKSGFTPQLGNADVSRVKTIQQKQQEINMENDNQKEARDVLHKTRNESILKMRELADNPSQILFQAKTFFPLDIFPDELIISGTKIQIKHYNFFYTYSTTTIPIQDIGSVEMSSTPFFATMKIINIRVKEPVVLNYLQTADAQRAKKIIDGLLIAQESGVDITSIEPGELLPQIEALAA